MQLTLFLRNEVGRWGNSLENTHLSLFVVVAVLKAWEGDRFWVLCEVCWRVWICWSGHHLVTSPWAHNGTIALLFVCINCLRLTGFYCDIDNLYKAFIGLQNRFLYLNIYCHAGFHYAVGRRDLSWAGRVLVHKTHLSGLFVCVQRNLQSHSFLRRQRCWAMLGSFLHTSVIAAYHPDALAKQTVSSSSLLSVSKQNFTSLQTQDSEGGFFSISTPEQPSGMWVDITMMEVSKHQGLQDLVMSMGFKLVDEVLDWYILLLLQNLKLL